ncbi:MAG: protein phosphatase 2C domain-containing protein [Planctomycetaceae bacterium]|jgi:protein phosphatase|nr:protein phosphatase 2C domain-containing protein [Planctomycetaceae bacterium]
MNQNGDNWKNVVRVSARTNVGLRRANNQDSHTIALASSRQQFRKHGHLFVVADGMGAHAAGELASKIAVDAISLSYSKRNSESVSEALQNSVYDAHKQIRTQSEQDEAFHDMGTTIDALVISPQGAVIAHVGDSRVYRLRDRVYEQLTFDHSLVWEIRASGKIPRDKIPAYIPKNVITRSLGPSENLKVDLEGPFSIRSGDYFLMCSDGLSGKVEDVEMGQILSILPPEYATELLINLANLRGGPDNITVVLAQVNASLEDSPETPGILRPEKAISGRTFSLLALICLIFALLGLALSGYSLFTDLHSSWANIAAAIITLFFGGGFFLLAGREISNERMADDNHSHQFGRAPYVRVNATPTPDFAGELATMVQQLRDAAKGEQWVIHWDEIDHHEQFAEAAVQAEDFSKAIYHYSLAINCMMRELKKQNKRK